MSLKDLLWDERAHGKRQQEVREQIGEELRTLRRKVGLSFRKVGKATGEDISNMSKLEKGLVWSRPMAERLTEFYNKLE